MDRPFPLTALPDVCLAMVYSFLPVDGRVNLSRVSKHLARVARDFRVFAAEPHIVDSAHSAITTLAHRASDVEFTDNGAFQVFLHAFRTLTPQWPIKQVTLLSDEFDERSICDLQLLTGISTLVIDDVRLDMPLWTFSSLSSIRELEIYLVSTPSTNCR